MRFSKIIFFLSLVFAGFSVCAQETNVVTLYTKLEAFEAQTEKVILKAWGQIGTVSVQSTIISVSCREATDVASGAKEFGVTVGIRNGNEQESRTVIDQDELGAVLTALDYISQVDLSATTLPSFQAIYRTRADLRFLAYNSTQRTGTVHALQVGYLADNNRIPLAPDQLNDLKVLMRAAKEKLDDLKKSGS